MTYRRYRTVSSRRPGTREVYGRGSSYNYDLDSSYYYDEADNYNNYNPGGYYYRYGRGSSYATANYNYEGGNGYRHQSIQRHSNNRSYSYQYGQSYQAASHATSFRSSVEQYRSALSRNRRQQGNTYRYPVRGAGRRNAVQRMCGGGPGTGPGGYVPAAREGETAKEAIGARDTAVSADAAGGESHDEKKDEAKKSSTDMSSQIEEILVRCQNLVLRMMLKEKDAVIEQLKCCQDSKRVSTAVNTEHDRDMEMLQSNAGTGTESGFSTRFLEPPDDPESQMGRTILSTSSRAAPSIPSTATGLNVDVSSLAEVCKAQHVEIEALRRLLAEKEWELLQGAERSKTLEAELVKLRQAG